MRGLVIKPGEDLITKAAETSSGTEELRENANVRQRGRKKRTLPSQTPIL